PIANLNQHCRGLWEVIFQMKQERPVTHVAERVALLIENMDGQRIAGLCALDVDWTCDGIAVVALLAHRQKILGRRVFWYAGPAAARVLGLDQKHLPWRHTGNRRRPAIEYG